MSEMLDIENSLIGYDIDYMDLSVVFSEQPVQTVSLEKKHQILCGAARRDKNRAKTDPDGLEFYAILPEEFKMYCEDRGYNEKELRIALKKGGYLYLAKYDECTRNCKVDGKSRRCICLYTNRAVTG